MLTDYLALGGVEIANAARAFAYSQCIPCCSGTLKTGGCDGIHDATSPYADVVQSWQTVATNLILNPSFELGGTATELRRNLAPNPFTVDGIGMSGRGGGVNNQVSYETIDGDAPVGPGTFGRTTRTVAPTSGSQWLRVRSGGEDLIPVTAGETYTLSAWTRSTRAASGGQGVIIIWVNDAGSTVSESSNSPSVVPGEWVLGSVTAVAPTGATHVFLEANVTSAAAVGDSLDATGFVFEEGSTAAPAFDAAGNGSPDPGYTLTWGGVAYRSPSIMTAATITNAHTDPAQAIAVQSSVWTASGQYALRLIPLDTSPGVEMWGVLELGKTYTVLVTGHLEEDTGATDPQYRRVWYNSSSNQTSAQLPPTAGTTQLRFTFTVDGTEQTLRFAGDPQVDTWWDDLLLIEGVYTGGYFDGVTLPPGADPAKVQTIWSGADNQSTSELQNSVVVSNAQSLAPAYSCADFDDAPWYDPFNDAASRLAGFYPVSVTGVTDSTLTAGVTEGVGDGGVIGSPRNTTRSVRVQEMIVGCGMDAAEYGLAWLKAALGENSCGRHGDACGTTDLDFFIDCPPGIDPSDTDYAARIAPYRRYLHGVSCTSGPIISETYELTSGAVIIVVEYILTAESPFVWGETVPLSNTGLVLTAYDDIPYNLQRYPSAEVADGVGAVIATQYAFNGSAEYGATGWSVATSGVSAGLSSGVSGDIAAVGSNSYRYRLLATGEVQGAVLVVAYDVDLTAIPAGAMPSVSVWGAALVFAGNPTVGALTASIDWRTTGGTVLSTTVLGDVPLDGDAVIVTGLEIPAGAQIARVRMRATGINAIAGDDLRVYADAVSLTVP